MTIEQLKEAAHAGMESFIAENGTDLLSMAKEQADQIKALLKSGQDRAALEMFYGNKSPAEMTETMKGITEEHKDANESAAARKATIDKMVSNGFGSLLGWIIGLIGI